MSVTIINYSEKAFAVIGDTKPIKDHLLYLGGKYNRFLKYGAGWIFSKKRLPAVVGALGVKMIEPSELPAATDPDEKAAKGERDVAEMVRANEEAYFDNFAAANNI